MSVYFAGTGQVETRASAYWRQRVQAIDPVAGQTRRSTASRSQTGREEGHGPAFYVTLSPVAQAQLEALRLDLTTQRAKR